MPKEHMIPSVKLLNNNTSEIMEWLFNLIKKFAERVALVGNFFKDTSRKQLFKNELKISDKVSNV